MRVGGARAPGTRTESGWRGRGWRRIAAAGALVLLAACSSGSRPAGSPAPGPSTTSTSTVTAPTAGPGDALAVLATLAVKGRAPKTGYDRSEFGPAWSDVDHNGCDTRNDILNRDLTDKQWRPGTHDCVVIAGTVVDPYTGKVLHFEKAHAIAVQIDHVVALSDAWQTGAQQLSDGGAAAVRQRPGQPPGRRRADERVQG